MILFHAEPDSEAWQSYQEYVDEMVVEGLFGFISRSLEFFVENMEPGSCQAPLFETHLLLNDSVMTFLPSLERDAGDGLYELIEGLIGDIFKTSVHVTRVAAHLNMESFQVFCTTIHYNRFSSKMQFWGICCCFACARDC